MADASEGSLRYFCSIRKEVGTVNEHSTLHSGSITTTTDHLNVGN